MPVLFPFNTVIYVFCGEIPVDLKAGRSFCHSSTHISFENNFGSRNFLVKFYGLTIGNSLLCFIKMSTDDLENLYFCYNLHKSVYYCSFK